MPKNPGSHDHILRTLFSNYLQSPTRANLETLRGGLSSEMHLLDAMRPTADHLGKSGKDLRPDSGAAIVNRVIIANVNRLTKSEKPEEFSHLVYGAKTLASLREPRLLPAITHLLHLDPVGVYAYHRDEPGRARAAFLAASRASRFAGAAYARLPLKNLQPEKSLDALLSLRATPQMVQRGLKVVIRLARRVPRTDAERLKLAKIKRDLFPHVLKLAGHPNEDPGLDFGESLDEALVALNQPNFERLVIRHAPRFLPRK